MSMAKFAHNVITKGYCIARIQSQLNSWFQLCKETQRPYVTIRPARKWAYVEIDLIGQQYDLHPIAALEISNLLQAYGSRVGIKVSVALLMANPL